jgi:hypothetical protein
MIIEGVAEQIIIFSFSCPLAVSIVMNMLKYTVVSGGFY